MESAVPNPPKKTNKPAPDNDWQTGVPYAKADRYQGTPGDPYPGPPEATKRKSVVMRDGTKITGGLQGVEPVPITLEGFNRFARGGAVKPWKRALAAHQRRETSARTKTNKNPNW
jgi:hypothetical protein